MGGQTKKGNGGNPKKRKGGGDIKKSGSSNTAVAAPPRRPQATASPQIDTMGKAKEIIIKWGFVCFSAWIYIQLKKYRQKQKEDNPFPHE